MAIIEIEGTGSMFHILTKYTSNYGRDHGFEPQYSVQIAVPKKGAAFDELKKAAKENGIILNSNSMKLRKGDEVTSKTGEILFPDQWLLNASTGFGFSIVDSNAKDFRLDKEPGNGTKAVFALNVKANSNGEARYYLAGVQILELEEYENEEYKFKPRTQTDTDEPEGF